MVNLMLDKVEAVYSKLVVVHPTVLLSIVDHFNRVARDTKKRVVGVLLGEYTDNNVLDVTNCFAVPFEEELNEADVWFFDHIYAEEMYGMMRRINSKEHIIGWYSSGPRIRRSDIMINEILRRYNTDPCFVVCNVEDESLIGLPTESYFTQEEIDADGNMRR
jgi:26S proteasome regulatory subunit N8